MLSLYTEGFEPTKHIALDLESNPFDRSGILPGIHDGIRTRNLQIRSLTRYPVAPHGQNSLVIQGLEPWALALLAPRSTN